jgi:adenylate kinase
MTVPKIEEAAQTSHDLEIKDAVVIFNGAWETLEEDFGEQNLRFPKELILLGGAPGAGKGTHTQFITHARGLTCPPIVVSQLLNTPEAVRMKESGQMVGDRPVVEIILRELLKPEYRDGAVLDGFPRTRVQVECLKLLVGKISALHKQYSNTPHAKDFRRPTVHAMVLFASEKTSVDRQLQRGREVAQHNAEVRETGIGELMEVRSTDLSSEKATRRYRVFKEQTWDALQSLKEIYHYHFINAEGPVPEVEENILKELQYQSSLELDPKTFDHLRMVPLAEEITIHARQQLVRRLDSYALEQPELFTRVVDVIQDKFMPIIVRHALSGKAVVNSENPLFHDALAISMLIDVFSERGFHAVVDKRIRVDLESVDLNTGSISKREIPVFRIQVNFEGSEIRRG